MPTSSNKSELHIGWSKCQHQQRYRWAQWNGNLLEHDGHAGGRDSYRHDN